MENINGQTKVIDGVVYQAVSAPVTAIPSDKAEIVTAPTGGVSVSETRKTVKLSNGQNFTVESVNINDPKSIITYGSNIQRQISAILESTAEMTVQQQKTFLDDETLTKIVSFEDSLDEANKQAQEKVGLVRGLLNKLRIGLNDETAKKEEAMKTYQGRYKDYTDNLKLVCQNIGAIANDALLDISQRAALAEELSPVIEMADITVQSGKECLEEYNKDTARIGEEDKTPDGQAIVTRRTQLSNAFLRQLNGLEKAVVLYKTQIQDYLLQQDISMTTVQVSYDFIDKQKPVLQMKASGTVYNRLENERLNSLLDVSRAANEAIKESSEATLENIRLATELSENSGFTMEAIETAMSSLEEGVALIKDRKRMLIERDHSEQAALKGINERLEEQKQEIINLIEDKSVAVLAIEEERGKAGRPRSLSTSSRRPRLGSRK